MTQSHPSPGSRGGEVVAVKLGGSLITDKRRPSTPRQDVLERLAREIARARPGMSQHLILSHGSGSFGHRAAADFRLDRGLESPAQLCGVTVTQRAAARLHALVMDALIEAGVPAFSLAPSSFLVARRGRPGKVEPGPLIQALELGLIPVTYGDVVLDQERGVSICSTETVIRAMTETLHSRDLRLRRVLWLGETDGVYGAAGETLAQISGHDLSAVLASVGEAAGVDVTGGMRHRIETAWELAGHGIRSFILNGLQPGVLERGLLGQEVPGTEITAR